MGIREDYLQELKNFVPEDEVQDILNAAKFIEGHLPHALFSEWFAESERFEWDVALDANDNELVYYRSKS